MTVPVQLAEVSFGRRGNPDLRKAFGEQQFDDEPGVALIGLMFAHFAGADLRGVPDPQLAIEFREQTLEPVNGSGGFHPHEYRLVKTAVERLGLAALVVEAALDKQLAGLFSGHGNLLIAFVKIATYLMIIARLLSSEPWSSYSCQSLPGRRSRGRHLISPD